MRDKIAVACKWPHAVATPRPENKEIALIPRSDVVKSGVVRVKSCKSGVGPTLGPTTVGVDPSLASAIAAALTSGARKLRLPASAD